MKPDGPGLCCQKCGYDDLQVKDSRASRDMIRRRRHCPKCNWRGTTFEAFTTDDNNSSSLVRAMDLRKKLDHLSPKVRYLIEALIERLSGELNHEDRTDA